MWKMTKQEGIVSEQCTCWRFDHLQAFYKNLPNYQCLLMYQQKLTQLPMIVDVPTVTKPWFDPLHGFYKKLPNYQSIWASEQSNAMPEVWPTSFFLAFYKLTQLLNPPFFAANEYFQIFNSLFASRSQESPGQFWFGEITQSAPWSRPTVQSTNFIEVLNSESFPMSALVRLQNRNSAQLSN